MTGKAIRLGVTQFFDGVDLRPGDVEIRDGRISCLGLSPGPGGTVTPGWLDLQVNGFAGVDVLHADEAALRRASRELLKTGVTAYLPTVITSDPRDRTRALAVIDVVAANPGDDEALVLGAHLEGPCLSPRFPGAHPLELLAEDWADLLTSVQCHRVRIVTLAPEVVDKGVVAALSAAGVAVSIGHTDVSAEGTRAAIAEGARMMTHAFNAHRLPKSRDGGPLMASLADERVVIAVIADGVHVAPENLIVLHRAAGGRIALITDAMVAAGLVEGTYEFGSLVVRVEGGRATLPDGTLAGSIQGLDVGIRNAASLWGLPAALSAVTSVPARVLGTTGSSTLAVGDVADLVVLDDALQVERTYLAGRCVWDRRCD